MWGGTSNHFTSTIWNPCIPSTRSFFTWEPSQGKMLNLDQLQRRGQSLPNTCYLCKVEEESINHIQHHRGKHPLAIPFSFVWCFLGAFFHTKRLLVGWHESFVGKRHKRIAGQLQCSFSGLYGKKGIQGLLIMKSNPIMP